VLKKLRKIKNLKKPEVDLDQPKNLQRTRKNLKNLSKIRNLKKLRKKRNLKKLRIKRNLKNQKVDPDHLKNPPRKTNEK